MIHFVIMVARVVLVIFALGYGLYYLLTEPRREERRRAIYARDDETGQRPQPDEQ